MNRFILIFIAGIITLSFGQGGLSAQEEQRNSLSDVEVIKRHNSLLYTFKTTRKPLYSVSAAENSSITLSFPGMDKPEGLGLRLADNPYIGMDHQADSDKTGFVLKAGENYSRVTCCWINESSLFLVSMEPYNETGNKDASGTGADIKDIRFGFKESAARMVIGASTRPGWKMEHTDPDVMMLFVDAISENIKTKRFSSDKWLESASVSELNDRSTVIRLNLNSPPDQAAVSWVSAGNRLVLDMAERPDEMFLSLLSAPDTKTEDTVAVNGPGQDEKKEFSNIARMKIDKKETAEKEISLPDIAFDIRPAVKASLPESEEISVDVDKLRPGEAFMLGRIRQAREIKDYNMGIALANQFLDEFPESVLREAVSFWRGDFYFDQWEKGDKNIGEKVIRAYEFAIDNFVTSRNVPPAYIRMATVASEMDNSYQALGYLSIVLTLNVPDLRPLAYLTRGKVFLQINQAEKAMKDFKVILEEYENTKYSMEANLWIGHYYHKLGLYREAEEKLIEIEKRYPGLFTMYPDSILLAAKNFIYLKKYREAREYLFRAVNIGAQQETIDIL
ncbi:MAG: hypothetical protein GX846_05630, partial [Deltaproteobacteria bacterium]|nr:hypothetical protein [Deltaproteobacteria bacterium]